MLDDDALLFEINDQDEGESGNFSEEEFSALPKSQNMEELFKRIDVSERR